MTTLMDIIEGCENYLGWQPPYRDGISYRQVRALEAHKLKNAMSTRPSGTITLENLALALEYSRRKRLTVNNPAALMWRIPDALKLAHTPAPLTDLAQQIVDAINWEREHHDPTSLHWIYRLTRAHGASRADTLTEWKSDGRGR